MKKMGVYIHIPFCKKKCCYCDFTSYANKQKFCEKYVQALIDEINNFFDNNEANISTIYIGGGTPSFIDGIYIKRIMDVFRKRNLLKLAKEITIEVNPGTVNKEKLKIYKNAGINRLSIGLQSTDDKELEQIGRIHHYNDFIKTYNWAREVGFRNINVDLMLGLPNQRVLDIKDSLEKIVKLAPEHISVYSLIVEEDTPISKMLEEGTLSIPDDETERNMYWFTKNYLELKGYNHYEISNFALDGFISEHNWDCWSQEEYIGFGVAAHSFVNNVRFGNIDDIEEYIHNCENKEFEKNRIIDEIEKDKFSQEKEFMLIGLRKIDGVFISDFKNKFGENPIFVFKEILNKLVEEELLEVDFDRIVLTRKGLDLANLVWEEFV